MNKYEIEKQSKKVNELNRKTKNTIANMMVDEINFIKKHNEVTSKRESLKKDLEDLLNW